MQIPIMIPIKPLAEKAGVSYDFIRKLCLAGKIVFIRAGTKYLINEEKFYEYLNTGDAEKEDKHD